MDEPKSAELLNQFLAGQSDAAAWIFDRYVERLLALARTRISPQLRRRIDPEDVVQSAYRSFFVHARNQEFHLTRSGDLWRLLASTTLNKLHGQVAKETAGKRSVRREIAEDSALANLQDHQPTIAEVVAVGEQLKLIMDGLSSDERIVLAMTLQGESIEEIGKAIERSPRTVRRLLAQAKRRFENVLLRDGVATPSRRGHPRSPAVEPAAPLRFSDYVLEQLLGSGGMGKVFRARDKRSGKTVAVKALHKSRLRDERAIAQFVQESQILAQMRHPNIVGVEGLGRFPVGGYFLVMEYVAGTDLQSRLAKGPLPITEAVAILKKVAAAIQHVHRQGIVHCDLKPGNVLLDDQDRVVVTDFGFAFMSVNRASAQFDSIGGTAGYLPPEVLRMESQPTRATDIYALGALLWTMVTGQLPSQHQLCPKKNEAAMPIEPICRRCLASDPFDRYPDVSELIEDLNMLPQSDKPRVPSG